MRAHPHTRQEVAAATEPLRSALWGDHKLAVLVPPGVRIPPAPGMTEYVEEEELTQDGVEAQANTMHELAGSSPFSGVLKSVLALSHSVIVGPRSPSQSGPCTP